MYGSGLKMCCSHDFYKSEQKLRDYLINELEYDTEMLESLFNGDCVDSPDGEAWEYLIKDGFDDNS